MTYDKILNVKETPQSEPILGSNQVPNSAGGFTFEVNDWSRLDRFLILGSEGGTYYIGEKPLTKDNLESVLRCIKANGLEVVNRVVAISDSGRAAKNEPALLVLAACTASDNVEVRKLAWNSLSKVARIPTHLFIFVRYREMFGGWGRLAREGLARWYIEKTNDQLAYQVLKYQQRESWSHADLLRLCHADDGLKAHIFSAITHPDGGEVKNERTKVGMNKLTTHLGVEALISEGKLPKLFEGVQKAKVAKSARDVASLVEGYNLTREMIPTEWLDDPIVYEALFQKMPMTAMVRNLGNMSKIGVLTPMSDISREVVRRLSDQTAIKKARLHPLNLLVAMKTYAQGKGFRGKGEWTVVPQVVDALDEALRLSFDLVEPTGKRYVFGLDVSGSMSSPCINGLVASCEVTAIMALVAVKTEPEHFIGGFSTDFMDLGITAKDTFLTAVRKTKDRNYGRTDCSVPITHALKHGIMTDVFEVITDNETWAGAIHPSQALKKYRQATGINAKMVVIGTAASPFTIANPSDAGMLDVVGMDTSVPSVIAEFVR